MSQVPNIIQSDIINQQWDDFWKSLPEILNIDNEQVNTLVITTTYETGSAEDIQLQKMMLACKFSTADYHIIQIPEGLNVAWHKIKAAMQPKYVILLGISPQQLGITILLRLFSANKFDGCIWIPGLSLADMEKQPDAKKELWVNGLKPIFVDSINT